jgi:cyanobactin maturation PatA/PatG family protease
MCDDFMTEATQLCGTSTLPDRPAANDPVRQSALVYALGTLAVDFGTQARYQAFVQAMPEGRNDPENLAQLLEFIETKPYYARSLTWVVTRDGHPMYAIVPTGPYAALAYEFLVSALRGTMLGQVTMNSFPGVIDGSATLRSGLTVPVIEPATRGMYSWRKDELVNNVLGPRPIDNAELQASFDKEVTRLDSVLARMCRDFRNLGMSGMERALNFSTTNAVKAVHVFAKTAGMQLDTIVVQRSLEGGPGTECYYIIMGFFTPRNMNGTNMVARFAVDVAGVIPVSVGPVRYWSQR